MLGFIAIGVAAASLLLNIIGLAIPYWEKSSIVGLHIGLWQYCGDATCITIPDILETSELKATRAFVILAMLVLAGAIVVAFLKLAVMKDQEILPKVAGACAILAGVLMIIGIIIYAAAVKGTGLDLHASFGLTIIAALGSFVAGGLFIVNKG